MDPTSGREPLTPDLQRQSDLAWAALAAAHVHDDEGVDKALNALSVEYKWAGLLGAVVGWGSMLKEALGLNVTETSFIRLASINERTGESVSVEETGAPREMIAAIRIFVAWINDDRDMALDLFVAAVDEGYGHETVGAALLLASVQLGPAIDKAISGAG